MADGVLFSVPPQTQFSSGVVSAGGKVFIYEPGTATKRNSYTTAALSVTHSNPVVADADGKLPGIYFDPSLGDIKYVHAPSTDSDPPVAAIDTEDNYPVTSSAAQIGMALYPRTTLEISAGVTPTNFQYVQGTVERYGTNTTPGTTDMTTAIQSAMDTGHDVVFGSVEVYLVTATLRPSSYTKISGQGMAKVTLVAYPTAPTLAGGTQILMGAAVTREKSVIQTGTTADPRYQIKFEDFTINFNRLRWSDGTVLTNPFEGASLAICYTEGCQIKRVLCVDAYSHNFDVMGTTNERGDEDATTYAAEQSRYVWIEECRAYHAGDDNFTSHMCSYVWFKDCMGFYPSGVAVPTNSNNFEIDDGSRNVYVTDCFGIGGCKGLEIKGHQDVPAPFNVHVDGFTAINNIRGFECRHMGWYYASNAAVVSVNQTTDVFEITGDLTGDLDVGETFEIDGSTGNDGIYTIQAIALNGSNTDLTVVEEIPDATADGNLLAQQSATAHSLYLDRINVVAPLRDTTYSIISDIGERAYTFKAYEGVHCGLLEVTDGREDLDDLEYADGISTGTELMRIFLNARNITIDKISGQGFSQWNRGVYGTSSSPGRIFIGHVEWTDGPKVECVRFTGSTPDVYLMSYNIEANHAATASSVGVRLSSAITPTNRRYLGPGRVSGYETTVIINGASGYPEGMMAFPGPVIIPKITETGTGTFTCSVRGTEITDLDSSGGAVTATLPDGVTDSQRKKITMSDASNSSTLSVTSHETSDPEVFTFAAITDVLILEWDSANAYWWTVKNIGAAT